MKPASQSLVFTHTPVTLIVAILFVAAVMVLAFIAWRRTGYRISTGLLEGLRVLIAIGIAITLNQPEWREVFEPTTKPTLAILADVSRSMDTRDVIDPAQPAAELRSRAELAKPLADTEAWRELAQRVDVVVETFSSAGQPAEEGTDLGAALKSTA